MEESVEYSFLSLFDNFGQRMLPNSQIIDLFSLEKAM